MRARCFKDQGPSYWGSALWRAAPTGRAALAALILSVGAAPIATAEDQPAPPELELGPADGAEIDPIPPEGETLDGTVSGGAGDGEEIEFTEDSWRALVEGKTLYYQIDADTVGREYYIPGTNRAVFEYAGGGPDRCFEGVWTVVNGWFCFEYDATHCFRHLERDGEIYARQTNGVDQRVFKKTEERLSCEPEFVS
ncbi:MAG: hypothetical protein AAF909_06535 [Pseudomonadota bacterium]